MDRIYPKGHIMAIMGLNTLSFLAGLSMVAGPFLKGFFPGSFQTTVHVALGALVALLAIFRLTLAYGSIWIDVCLAAFGVITLLLPSALHMRWDAHYVLAHMAAGGVIVAVAVISTLLTTATLAKIARAG